VKLAALLVDRDDRRGVAALDRRGLDRTGHRTKPVGRVDVEAPVERDPGDLTAPDRREHLRRRVHALERDQQRGRR
jgi:hypothetical protein